MTRWSGGANPSRADESLGWYAPRFTKLGITRKSHWTQPNARLVSSFRYSDTALTRSDCSIENLVIA